LRFDFVFTLCPNASMSHPEQNPQAAGAPVSPEEAEAALVANQADAEQAMADELATLKAQNADLADQYLRAKAEAENARRRADDEVSKAGRARSQHGGGGAAKGLPDR
jgi:molecular chaperone GrpE (heat shock protein)